MEEPRTADDIGGLQRGRIPRGAQYTTAEELFYWKRREFGDKMLSQAAARKRRVPIVTVKRKSE